MKIEDLKATIADLTVEIERIKKTSRQRFEENKKLKQENKKLNIIADRANCLLGFLVDNGFEVKYYDGFVRFDYTAMNAIRYLQDLNKVIEKPRVDGYYNVTIDGERFECDIYHSICWMILIDGCRYPLHQVNASEFELIGFSNDKNT